MMRPAMDRPRRRARQPDRYLHPIGRVGRARQVGHQRRLPEAQRVDARPENDGGDRCSFTSTAAALRAAPAAFRSTAIRSRDWGMQSWSPSIIGWTRLDFMDSGTHTGQIPNGRRGGHARPSGRVGVGPRHRALRRRCGQRDDLRTIGRRLKVSTLMVMPAAKGLFHKAAVQSGSTITLGARDRADEVLVGNLAHRAGRCERQAGRLAKGFLNQNYRIPSRSRLRPERNGTVIPRHPFEPDAPEISADVPLIIGYTREDAAIRNLSEARRSPKTA